MFSSWLWASKWWLGNQCFLEKDFQKHPWCFYVVFFINFEHVSSIILVFPLLTFIWWLSSIWVQVYGFSGVEKSLEWKVNPLRANVTKWSNTLKQFVQPTNCLSVFDHLVALVLKGLNFYKPSTDNSDSFFIILTLSFLCYLGKLTFLW